MKLIFQLLPCTLVFSAFSQKMNYQVDLNNCVKDQLTVTLNTAYHGKDTAVFNFPMTVPGTYAVLDYGRFITQFKAFDSAGKVLKVKKKGNNSFTIVPGKDVAKVQYVVDDSWEEKNGDTKIFEPAGTGFESGKYFYINNGGLFGYFGFEWNNEYEIAFRKPKNLSGFSTLVQKSKTDEQTVFWSKNYHELIDNPILFTPEKDENIRVQGTDVIIASYHEGIDSSAYYIKNKIDSAMVAIDRFVGGKLPVDNYAFLNFIKDYRELEAVFSGEKKIGLFQKIKLGRSLGGQGFGALEHGHSSSYFLPDFGHNSYTDMVYETGVHEFMHIYSPLSLHSQFIGEFNYTKPVMSKHLWLYEGTTEYFSVLVAMQGGLRTVKSTIENTIKGKIMSASEYPDNMPFTVMSANVFDKPYSDQYSQVYERGAIMGMLLDIEIMRLTNGSKTLKTVIFELCSKYGSGRSFNEDTFIDEFVGVVHPDLRNFFTKYVEGTTPLAIEETFKVIGIDYSKSKKGTVPYNFLNDKNSGVTADNRIINGKIAIKKADAANPYGLKAKDQIDYKELRAAYRNEDGSFIPEGTMVTIHADRKGKQVPLTFPAKFNEGTLYNTIEIMKNMTPEQEKLFKLWSTGK
jgi:predicted metalloprotease with PDZ domain